MGYARMMDCLKVQEWVFKSALENNVKNIIFAGDLFHDRQKVDVFTYQHTFEIFNRYQNELNIWLLLGNHDMWHNEKRDISSVIPLGTMKNVRVVNEPCTLEIDNFPISFMPYTKNPIETLSLIKNDSPYKVLFGHAAIDGAVWNTRANTYAEVLVEHDGDMVKVDSDIFDGWDRVFLGHYHAEQKMSHNLEYIGSPLELSYGEAFQKKHIILFDTDTKKRIYIENNFSPKHYILSPEEAEKQEVKEGDFIKIQVEKDETSNALEIQKRLSKLNLAEAKVEPVKKRIAEKIDMQDIQSVLYKDSEMAETYIKVVGTKGLDSNELLAVFNRIRELKDQKNAE
jgi:DNA repair exonuclease SbcCD nuclease subunit